MVNLEDDHPEAVAALVDLLYKGDYERACQDGDAIDQMFFHIRVYYFAAKYDIKCLSKSASRKLTGAVPRVYLPLISADQAVKLIQFAYSFDTVEKDHDQVRKFICGLVLSRPLYLDDEEVLEAAKQHPNFSRDIIVVWRDWGRRESKVEVPCSQLCDGSLSCTIECNVCDNGKQRAPGNLPAHLMPRRPVDRDKARLLTGQDPLDTSELP